jgi:DNA-binding XRE family transcriptional regulator
MFESRHSIQQIRDRFKLSSDYVVAKKLGITQPEANLIRRGRKVPNPELCIHMSKLLGKNPVELLLVAQKDKASSLAKPYWAKALAATRTMLAVPQFPPYLPKKIDALGQELRQMATQTLCFEGSQAQTEAVRLMESAEQSVESVMERWKVWRKGESLYPNYLISNQQAILRKVAIRRLLVLRREEMKKASQQEEVIQVMNDQYEVGIEVFFAFREDLRHCFTFQRMIEDYNKIRGNCEELNAALFDKEMLIFSRSYGQVSLGGNGQISPITRIHQLQITWKPKDLQALNPAPLFDMTRYVFPYKGRKSFQSHIARVKAKASLPVSTG